MILESCYPVICTDKLDASTDFFKNNFDFSLTFESDWYMSLRSNSNPNFELALLDSRHPSIPENYRNRAQGVIINFEVADVDNEYQRLKANDIKMILDIRSEEWGQRHFIVEDPNGILIDVIQNIEPTNEFKQDYRD